MGPVKAEEAMGRGFIFPMPSLGDQAGWGKSLPAHPTATAVTVSSPHVPQLEQAGAALKFPCPPNSAESITSRSHGEGGVGRERRGLCLSLHMEGKVVVLTCLFKVPRGYPSGMCPLQWGGGEGWEQGYSHPCSRGGVAGVPHFAKLWIHPWVKIVYEGLKSENK